MIVDAILKGERVTLVPAEEKHAKELLRAIEPDNTKNLSFFSESVSLSREIEYLKKMKKSRDDMLFVVISNKDRKIVGTAGFHEYDFANRNARLGALIFRKDDRGRGYGGEAIQLLFGCAFERLNFHKIYIRLLKTNERAERYYRKFGFVKEGCLREEYYLNGIFHDMIELSILKKEWENLIKKGGGK